jgi:hypothetical protein
MKCLKVVACVGAMRNLYRDSVAKFEGKSPLGRPRHKFGDNIEEVLKEIGCYGADWINLAQDKDTRVSCEHGYET